MSVLQVGKTRLKQQDTLRYAGCLFLCFFRQKGVIQKSRESSRSIENTSFFEPFPYSGGGKRRPYFDAPPFCPAPYIIKGRKAFRKAPSLPLTEEKSFCTFERNCGCLLTYCFALNIQKKNISPQKRRFQCKKGRFASKKGKICPKKRILRKKGKL